VIRAFMCQMAFLSTNQHCQAHKALNPTREDDPLTSPLFTRYQKDEAHTSIYQVNMDFPPPYTYIPEQPLGMWHRFLQARRPSRHPTNKCQRTERRANNRPQPVVWPHPFSSTAALLIEMALCPLHLLSHTNTRPDRRRTVPFMTIL